MSKPLEFSRENCRENCENYGIIFFCNFDSTCDLTDVPASVYDREIAVPPYDSFIMTLFSIFYDFSLSCNLFLKAELRQFRTAGFIKIYYVPVIIILCPYYVP